MANGFTPKIQKLLIYAMKNDGFNFEEQCHIFKNKRYFDAVNYLKRHGLVRTVCNVCFKTIAHEEKTCGKKDIYHNRINEKNRYFKLTLHGYSLAFLLPKDKSTGRSSSGEPCDKD